MKLKHFEYRGAFSKDGSVGFSDRGAGLFAAESEGADALARAFKTAVYGASDEDFEGLQNGAELKLEFSADGKDYLLRRFYENGGESTELIETTDGKELAIGSKRRKEILDRVFGQRAEDSEGGFEEALRLIGIGKSELDAKRAEVREKRAEAETALYETELMIARLGTPVPPERGGSFEEEREAIEKSLNRAAEKERIAAEARAAREDLEAHLKKSEELAPLKELLNKDDAVRAAKGLYDELRSAEDEEARLVKALNECGERTASAEKKNAGGDSAEKECEADFILKSERLSALRAKFLDEMCLADAENSEFRQSLQFFFRSEDPKITELAEKKKRLDSEYEALTLSITSLENKKKSLVRPMSYKKAVIDGTVYEYKIEKLTAEIEDMNRRSGELQLETAAKAEDIKDAEAEIRGKTAARAELLASLLNGAKTVEEAMNADATVKNEAYAAFVTAENLAAEIAALREKADNLTRKNAENDDKRRDLERAKTELEVNLVKLRHKKEAFEAEFREKCAENIYAQEAAKLRLGDRCPVCDSYVVKKNEIPRASSEAVEENIRAARAEIARNEKLLERISLKLGAYLSTAASGDAYLASISNTLSKKEGILNKIYAKYGASGKEDFVAKIREIGLRSQAFHRGVKTYHELIGEIAAATEKKAILENAVQQLTGRENRRILANSEKAKTELEAALKEYQKLMPVFGGRPAKELLSGSLIDDIELETVEGDLVAQTKNFREVTVQKIETDRMLLLLKNKLVSDTGDAEGESAVDIILKETARTARALSEDLKAAEAEYEDAKLRLAAVRRVNKNAEKSISDARSASAGLELRIAAAKEKAESANRALKTALTTLGISEEELAGAALSSSERAKAEKILTEYAEKSDRLKWRAEFTAARPVTLELIDVDGLRARLKELDEEAAAYAREVAKYEFLEETRSALSNARNAARAKLAEAALKTRILALWDAAIGKNDEIDYSVLSEKARETANGIFMKLRGDDVRFTAEGGGFTFFKNGEAVEGSDAELREARFSSELSIKIFKRPFTEDTQFLVADFTKETIPRIDKIKDFTAGETVVCIIEKE